MGSIRILGVDPGLRVTGYGVIEKEGSTLRYIDSGVIKTASGELPERLGQIFSGVMDIVLNHAPNEVAVEKVFVNINPQSTLLLGQARGAVIAALVHQGLPVSEYTALQVKQAVVGHGHAEKIQVQDMVKRLLALRRAPPSDPADALACAICHAHSEQSLALKLLSQGRQSRRRGRIL